MIIGDDVAGRYVACVVRIGMIVDTLNFSFIYSLLKGTASTRSTKPLEAKDNDRQRKTISGNSHIPTSREIGPSFWMGSSERRWSKKQIAETQTIFLLIWRHCNKHNKKFWVNWLNYSLLLTELLWNWKKRKQVKTINRIILPGWLRSLNSVLVI